MPWRAAGHGMHLRPPCATRVLHCVPRTRSPRRCRTCAAGVLLNLWRVPQDVIESGRPLRQRLALAARNAAVQILHQVSDAERQQQSFVDSADSPEKLCSTAPIPLGRDTPAAASSENLLALAFFPGMTLLQLCHRTGDTPGKVKNILARELSAAGEERVGKLPTYPEKAPIRTLATAQTR